MGSGNLPMHQILVSLEEVAGKGLVTRPTGATDKIGPMAKANPTAASPTETSSHKALSPTATLSLVARPTAAMVKSIAEPGTASSVMANPTAAMVSRMVYSTAAMAREPSQGIPVSGIGSVEVR